MVRLTDRPDMTLDVYRGRKTTIQQQLYRDIFSIVFLDDNFVCSHLNRLIQAILMSTHNTPFLICKKEIHPKLS